MTNLQEIITGYRTTFQKQRFMATAAMKSVKNYFQWLYFQYMIVTCGIDFEHWEQMMIHIFVITTFTMLAYTTYVFIPIHLHLAYQFFLQFLIK
ncbi:serine palmitoyltransferase small subunit B-like [Protobothrops mucrosquamatus]|uniref:serine palmitoyltransferase small subunit B-like n=1 Tax=Protobothrops mucrosquamatus TaxID=103944 RepID=UPI0010FB583C|nr:serine palmitoyltransferase small subunit B-like [Protobothrops mucrosquamatus]